MKKPVHLIASNWAHSFEHLLTYQCISTNSFTEDLDGSEGLNMLRNKLDDYWQVNGNGIKPVVVHRGFDKENTFKRARCFIYELVFPTNNNKNASNLLDKDY